MKKLLALLLAVVMVVSVFAACKKADPTATTGPNATDPTGTPEQEIVFEKFEGDFIYKDSVSVLASSWNPHTYQSADQAYPLDYTTSGLFTFVYNDYFHPIEGKDDFAGYVIMPDMAASMPVDVTEKVKAEHPEFGIPEDATTGFAYTIDLNDYLCFDDGTVINAQTYVESMKRMLDPKLLNYRAEDVYTGSLVIAGAKMYANQGHTVTTDNGVTGDYTIADLVKGDDGVYTTPEGFKISIAVNYPLDWTSGNTLKQYVDAYGDQAFGLSRWDELVALMDEDGLVPVTDDTLAMLSATTTTNPGWNETDADLPNYLVYDYVYPDGIDFSTVGIYASGENQITVVLENALSGFYLYYNLGVLDLSLVHIEKYDSLLKEDNGVWTSTYNTNVETAVSYGPYKVSDYQLDKSMHFVKNEKWWGYTDGKHVYQDPEDGLYYPMYQTTEIDTQVVAESSTNKMMFLKGELMGYGLQAEDFATYRQSEYCYATPSETIFFLILNGHMESINSREAAADFDTATTDLQCLTLKSFHQALGLTYDKDLFAATISPARSGGYGIIGSSYIYDPETGAKYRDTDQAKQVLCDFYGVDVAAFASLDEAVASITGYDPELAKTFYQQAFDEAIAAGYITDADGDGISDQTVSIEYALSSDSDFMTKTVDYLNEKVAEVTVGTPFEGKINFYKSAPYGSDWSNKIREGLSDTVLGGWSGSALDPFGLTDLYTNPSYQYDGAWYDATQVTLTINVPVDGVDTDVTMSLKQWSDCLNGATVTVDGVEYNYGDGIADVETRLDILAACEGKILESYNYLPMLQDGSMSLLSQQVYYVIEEYNPIIGRGGITYAKYNYTDAEWAAYVAEQGGELQY